MSRSVALTLLLGLSACAATPVAPPVSPQPAARVQPPPGPPLPPPSDSEVPRLRNRKLFERLGGLAAIEDVVDGWLTRAIRDPRIRDRFYEVDRAQLRLALIEQACASTGGPCVGFAEDWLRSAPGLELVALELDALGEDLAGTLDELGVGEREHREMLGLYSRLRPRLLAPKTALRPIAPERLAVVTMLANFLPPGDEVAQALLARAVEAGERGQRTYAEQLFSRAEVMVGAERLMSASEVFRVVVYQAPPTADLIPAAAEVPVMTSQR